MEPAFATVLIVLGIVFLLLVIRLVGALLRVALLVALLFLVLYVVNLIYPEIWALLADFLKELLAGNL